MNCGMSMVKYVLFVFNLLCSICGILLIVFGGILLSHTHNFDNVSLALSSQQVPITMIVLGMVILIVSWFGCCGAIRESYCMSMTYSIMLFVLMIGQLALVILLWMQKESYLNVMNRMVEEAWKNRTRRSDYMDAIQINMECCGYYSYTDYNYQGFFPPSCCKDTNNCRLETSYRRGCKAAVMQFWDKNSDIIKYTGLIIAAIEFVGFIFACCLANNIRNHRRRAEY